jgi:hypothetical protein
MDFQEGNITYCTRGNTCDNCSFKLAAYRVPPVSITEGQQLQVHVKLEDSSNVIFSVTL